MNKKRVERYKRAIEHMSSEQFEELLYQAFLETPDEKMDFDLIEAICSLRLPGDQERPPVDVDASYAAFREQYLDLFDEATISQKSKFTWRRVLIAALVGIAVCAGLVTAFCFRH